MDEIKSKYIKRERLIIIIPVVVALIGVLVIFLLSLNQSQYTFTEKGIQLFAGARTEIPVGTEVALSKDGSRYQAVSKGNDIAISDLPIYLTETDGIVIPMYSLVYQPRSLKYGSLQNFGLCYTKDSNVYVSANKKDKLVLGGFIYDGKDTYILLEDMELSVNNHIFQLSKYSYCYAVYGNVVVLYDYKTDTFYRESPQTPLIATTTNKDYSISMLDDILTNTNGKKEILYGEPRNIDSIFKLK